MLKDNVGYYQNQVVRIDDTDFILSTLWSYIPPTHEYVVSHGLNDFYQTLYEGHQLTVDDFNRMHQFCLDFIKQSVQESTAERIVVVTHHLPTRQVVAPQHLGSDINSGFATELGDFIADSRIDVWIYGHSHTNIDTTIGHTKIVCNQMGYVFANEHLTNGFDFGKMIEI
jgi:predicted phosphohydrolase